MNYFSSIFKTPLFKRRSRIQYLKYKEQARTLAHSRLEYFNRFYGCTYKRVFVKNQKSRWGSCSSKGNLNFNYKIALLPSHLADYIIVHELCHLKEFNHADSFWKLVEKTIPDYKKRRNDIMKLLS